MRASRRRLWLAAAVAVAIGAYATVTAVAAQAATGCRVDYTITNQWPGGFGTNVVITNLGDPITSWNLGWTFTTGQTVTQLWNGTYTQTGNQVTVTNDTWNGTIPTAGTANFGFNGTYTTTNPIPTTFTLNGTTCS